MTDQDLTPAGSGAAREPALDPLYLPLHGSRLIEASAGTGKTWTIAALYLRLVLGHGEAHTQPPRSAISGSRALAPSEILVMTFTRAATRELADRIRQRLQHAARCFRGELTPDAGDGFLQALMAAYVEGPVREAAAWRLALAAESMDDAAVHTIDAWCQRMLKEHAFDSAQWFDEELLADEAALRIQAVQDFWRREVVPLDGLALDTVLSIWPNLDALQLRVAALIDRVDVLPADGGLGAATHLPAWLAARHEALRALKAGWGERADRIGTWLGEQRRGKGDPFSKNLLNPESVAKWLQQIRAWSAHPTAEALVLEPPTGARRLTPDGILGACLKGRTAPALIPEFAAFERLQETLAARPSTSACLLQFAALSVARVTAELKQRQGRFGFADLQIRLDRALAGPQGERLRARIRAQLPVALVDEFQDTSPLQYRLFDRLYGVAADDPATALLLIGDPKQAIYSFRGADIYSYLRARADTTGRHHMLDTNFRSTEALVAAVNTVFERAEATWPGGAFGFDRRSATALPFVGVQARGRAERLVAQGQAIPALQVQLLPEPLAAEDLRRRLARHAAAQIVSWLNDPGVGFEGCAAPTPWRRLAPSDLAVLVRSRTEAEAVRAELRHRGVASVYLSDQESVFQSPEAQDLLRWLQAVAEPLNAALVRNAYATRLAGLRLDEMAALLQDEAAWEARVALLLRLRGVWQRQGALTLVRQTLHALDLPARCLGSVDGDGADALAAGGERRLTNLLHLGELLQQASDQLDGEQAQLRWLAEEIASTQGAADERVVRLESDAQLVQVVTVHKSKGLEYPVVLLPFAASARRVSKARRSHVERVDEASGERRLDFEMGEEALAQADHERLREDLRLLYVALTRARHALWLGVGLAKGRSRDPGAHELHRSALGYLLGGGEPLPGDAADVALSAWAQASPDITLQRLCGAASRDRLDRGEAPPPLGPALRKLDAFERDWRIGSFSGLVRDLAAHGGVGAPMAAGDALRQERLQELIQASDGEDVTADDRGLALTASAGTRTSADPGAVSPAGAAAPWHQFPRGALPGNFLHDLLETVAEDGFASIETAEMQQRLRWRCERDGHGERADGVVEWLRALLATPLPGLDAPLAALETVLPEMEFWMPSLALRSEALDAVCRAHCWPGVARPALVPRDLDGLLMGFADLVVEHDGRWWVLDYKSNALAGPDAPDPDAAYHADALQAAMLGHRYELQAGLYLLALHRLLRTRLGEAYVPALHLGGAVYVFLRGLRGPQAGCVVLSARLEWMDDLDACLVRGVDEEGRA